MLTVEISVLLMNITFHAFYGKMQGINNPWFSRWDHSRWGCVRVRQDNTESQIVHRWRSESSLHFTSSWVSFNRCGVYKGRLGAGQGCFSLGTYFQSLSQRRWIDWAENTIKGIMNIIISFMCIPNPDPDPDPDPTPYAMADEIHQIWMVVFRTRQFKSISIMNCC